MQNTTPEGGKSAACSVSEFVQILRQANMNGANRLFGGHLITWMDEVAAVSARRYADGPVTTACIENTMFLKQEKGERIDAFIERISKVNG